MVAGVDLREQAVPAACAAVALLLAAGTTAAAIRPAGWNVTVLPRVDAHTTMGAAALSRDHGFRPVSSEAYDGQFYWGVAVDPLGRGGVHAAFDKPSYRYGHPLLGWLGWLLSGGRADAAAGALLALGLLTAALGAWLAAALGRARGGSGWEGLFVALNPGLVYAAVHALAEPLCVALVLAAAGAYLRGRSAATWPLLALLPLAKEELLLVVVSFAAWDVRQRRPRRAVVHVSALLPAVLWWVYARVHFGAWFTTGDSALGAPFNGWRRAVLDAGVGSLASDQNATLVVLVCLLGLLAFAGVRALRLRDPLSLLYVLLGLVALCLAPNATTLLRDALRNTSILVALVPFVATARGAATAGDVRYDRGVASSGRGGRPRR